MDKEKKKQDKEKEDNTDSDDLLQEAEDLDEENLENDVNLDEEFSFSSGILATNKEVRQKKVKNLEEEIEEEGVVKKEEEDEKLYGKKRDEEDKEDQRDVKYDSGQRDASDFYDSNNSSDFYSGNKNDEFYTNTNEPRKAKNFYSTGEAMYSGNGNGGEGNVQMGFYDPRTKKENQQEKDWVSGPRFSSGLEDLSKKAKKAKMSYSFSSKKDSNTYN